MARVEDDVQNRVTCLCPGCPVQAKSACILGRRPQAEQMLTHMKEMQATEDGGMAMQMSMPSRDESINLYCASTMGKSTCSDLDQAKHCMCGHCQVLIGNRLKSRKYCLKGSADDIG